MSKYSVTRSTTVGKTISRADLLRILHLTCEDTLQTIAELSGYQASLTKPAVIAEETEVLKWPAPAEPGQKEEPAEQPKSQAAPVHFYRIIDCRPSTLSQLPEQQIQSKKALYKGVPDLDLTKVTRPHCQPPEKLPQVPWSQLWPILQQILTTLKRSPRPDIKVLAQKLAQAQIPLRLPRQSKKRWIAQVQVLIDETERMTLFGEDITALRNKLEKWRGKTGLHIQYIVGHPGENVRIHSNKKDYPQPWNPPEPGSAIFIISDLGVLDLSGQTLQAWIGFGVRLRRLGFLPIVWFPLPQRYLTPELITLFDCYCWTMYSDLQKVSWVRPRLSNHNTALQDDMATNAGEVLAWLSPLVQIEPRLVRAVCRELATGWQDSGIEAAVWLHDNLERHSFAGYFKSEIIETHREQFRALRNNNPALAERIVAVLRHYHAHLFPTLYHEEMLVLSDLIGEQMSVPYDQQIKQATKHFRQLTKALDKKTPMDERHAGSTGLPAFLWHYARRQHQAIFDQSDDERFSHLPAIQGILYRDYIDDWLAFTDQRPLSTKYVQSMLAFARGQVNQERYVLCMMGQDRVRLLPEQQYWEGESGFSVGFRLSTFNFRPDCVFHHISGDKNVTPIRLQGDRLEIILTGSEHHTLHLCGQALTLERLSRPEWVEAISRQQMDSNQSYDPLILRGCRTADQEPNQWFWHNPTLFAESVTGKFDNTTLQTLSGFWYDLPPGEIYIPDWADNADRDCFGLYADVGILGVVQRFRWIAPGSFLMGSPEGEEGRFDDETQHQVNLSQGFWLADTACTQALWQAVMGMGKNLSRFKGNNRPVETISWNDIQSFLKNLNEGHPGLALRLPTEAEWEYACRANTIGAFNFNSKLTLENVNYNGGWDHEDKWDEIALRQTADVKSYLPNPWGLYEMHGNVWEWCQDRYDKYRLGSETDPEVPETNHDRILRGGAWSFGGRFCRSGNHNAHYGPGNALDCFGFRLARAHDPSYSGADQQRLEHTHVYKHKNNIFNDLYRFPIQEMEVTLLSNIKFPKTQKKRIKKPKYFL
jgi:formylglycine-generating enzyme required for sulfatase activity